MKWVLLWAVLIVLALAVYGVLGLRLWRQGKALTAELAAASQRLAEVTAALEDLADRTQPGPAAPSTPVAPVAPQARAAPGRARRRQRVP
jgi:hypothetical protein